MKISILCSDSNHPVFRYLRSWQRKQAGAHEVDLVGSPELLIGGDLLFLISCSEIIRQEIRSRYKASLVIHASDLPKGRGWSPHVWQIIQGNDQVAVTLLEAADRADTGAIWAVRAIELEGHELADEINEKLFSAELALMDFAVQSLGSISPRGQDDSQATYYRRRNPEDSRIDPAKTIGEQFDLLRVADPRRYPAFFDYRGYRYIIRLEKTGKASS